MLLERKGSRNRKISLKQHIKYFTFRSKIQLDHPVQPIPVSGTGLFFRLYMVSTGWNCEQSIYQNGNIFRIHGFSE